MCVIAPERPYIVCSPFVEFGPGGGRAQLHVFNFGRVRAPVPPPILFWKWDENAVSILKIRRILNNFDPRLSEIIKNKIEKLLPECSASGTKSVLSRLLSSVGAACRIIFYRPATSQNSPSSFAACGKCLKCIVFRHLESPRWKLERTKPFNADGAEK